jgi:hypothetical protein
MPSLDATAKARSTAGDARRDPVRLHQRHALPGLSQLPRCAQPRDAATHHDHIGAGYAVGDVESIQ